MIFSAAIMIFCLGLCSLPLPITSGELSANNAVQGSVWPRPVRRMSNDTYLIINPSHFSFKVVGHGCDIMQEAFRRYYRVIFGIGDKMKEAVQTKDESHLIGGLLNSLHVYLLAPCESIPTEYMDEHYELRVNTDGLGNAALLTAQSIWGILRGLETFSQIVVPINGYQHAVETTAILDFPQFPHRGLLIDTSRHFIPSSVIIKIIDGMSYSKLNVLHWHIVDDQSFPFESETFPSLSMKGAYDAYIAVYTHADIRRIVEHARLRGIRVIPEFDTPGHTLSWGPGLPGFLTTCYDGSASFGPVDPTREENYRIVKELIREIVTLFPDNSFHLGGDEVNFSCWKSNPNITAFMNELGISGDYAKLESFYIQKLLRISQSFNLTSVVWQEVFDNGISLNPDTIVHIWTGIKEYELAKVTSAGHKALLSTCWYLDHLESGGDWWKFYQCSPLDFSGSAEQKRLVIGGEACMWGESVDETNIQQRIWPRACAMAEVLWYGHSSFNDAEKRLTEHACRLKKRAIPAQPPNGPDYCPYYYIS